jgi:4-amino-4-deoxy-L-arabinose transferase-like glycosyltransferase
MPELMIDLCRVGNESVALVTYTSLTLLLLIACEQPRGLRLLPITGVILGIGLLTKAYFIAALPALVVVGIFSLWRWPRERRRITLYVGAGIMPALLISFPWYWHNHLLTGSWSGEGSDIAAAHLNSTQLIAAIPHVNWIGGVISVLVSHIWFGGWSFLKLPKAIYVLFGCGMMLVALGLMKVAATCWGERPHSNSPRLGRLVVVGGLYLLFWIATLYHVFVTYVATGISASTGWYMYAVVVAEMLLVCCGLLAVIPVRWRDWIVPSLTAAFTAIDFYGTYSLLLPYHTGMIAHVPGTDIVHPATLRQLLAFNIPLLLHRLATNKPAALGPATFVTLFALYCLATLATVAISFLAMRTANSLNRGASALAGLPLSRQSPVPNDH